MVAPISVPQQTPAVPVNNARRGSQSFPFSPPGPTSLAAATALGTSPPPAVGMSIGSGFLSGSVGLSRSISNGKQMGQTPLMSPAVGSVSANDKDARGQGILRRLSLGAGASRPNFKPAVTSPAMPHATDTSVDPTHTDITSSTSYFNTLPSPPGTGGTSLTPASAPAAGKSAPAPSFYANPFSGAVLHEAHDEHEHDLPGISSLHIGPRRASVAVPTASEWHQEHDHAAAQAAGDASRPRKVSFGWTGFIPRKDAPSSSPAAAPSAPQPPASTLVRSESPASAPITQQDPASASAVGYKFRAGEKTPVSVTVQQVSVAAVLPAREESTTVAQRRETVPAAPSKPAVAPAAPQGMLAPASARSRGRRGSESAAGGKKRSVSPMAEHILRGGPGQF